VTRLAFMIAQRAFLKLYLLNLVEKHRGYGYQMLEELKTEFKPHGYVPPLSEIYRALHELVQEGILYRTKKLKGGDPSVDFQEIVLYHFTDDGMSKAELYRKQVKADLDRCLGMLNKAVADNYY
jgi:DNA-binding PadR family transcriptional regulator